MKLPLFINPLDMHRIGDCRWPIAEGRYRESAEFIVEVRSMCRDHPEHIGKYLHGGKEPDPFRLMDRVSIRAFMEQHRDKLKGRVLDFGAGTQPYRDLVEGEYVPYELNSLESVMDGRLAEAFDAVICNQVLQYTAWADDILGTLPARLKRGGHLIVTYATNWPEVPNDCYGYSCDRFRYTFKAMEEIIARAMGGYYGSIVDHQRRCEIRLGSFVLPIGGGIVGRKP